jgi:hypothetical protein
MVSATFIVGQMGDPESSDSSSEIVGSSSSVNQGNGEKGCVGGIIAGGTVALIAIAFGVVLVIKKRRVE